MTDNKPASGDHTTHGVPHGRTSLTPHIVVSRAGEAVEFYRDVLGARVEDITRMGDLIAHAELDFGSGFLTVSDPLPGYGPGRDRHHRRRDVLARRVRRRRRHRDGSGGKSRSHDPRTPPPRSCPATDSVRSSTRSGSAGHR